MVIAWTKAKLERAIRKKHPRARLRENVKALTKDAREALSVQLKDCRQRRDEIRKQL